MPSVEDGNKNQAGEILLRNDRAKQFTHLSTAATNRENEQASIMGYLGQK